MMVRGLRRVPAAILLAVVLVGCAAAGPDGSERTFFTSQALWLKKESNWLTGARWRGNVWRSHGDRVHVPVNTAVEIWNQAWDEESRYVEFRIPSLQPARVRFNLESADPKGLFAREKVELAVFPEEHRAKIRRGEIAVGMTRRELLLSWGYPYRRTPRRWTYRTDGGETLPVPLENGRVRALAP